MIFLKKHSFHILNILAILFGFIFIMSYLQGDVCTDHDHWYVYNAGILVGRIPSLFLCKIFYKFIPDIFNVHINDVSAFIIPIFDAFALSVSAIFMLKIYYLFSKKQTYLLNRKSFFILYPLGFIIIAIIPLLPDNIDLLYFSAMASTLRYYDHVFNFVFFTIFFYFIIKIIFFPVEISKGFHRLRKRFSIIEKLEQDENPLSVNNTSNQYKLKSSFFSLFCINALILGMSTEFLIIISNLFCFLILCFFIIQIKRKNNAETYKNNIKYLITIELFLLLGSIIDFSMSTYSKGQLGGYGAYSAFQNLINIKEEIIPFLQSYTQYIINENIVSILIILVLNIAIHFIIKNKENNIKINIIQGILTGGCLLFFLSLIFLEDSSLVYPIEYWVEYWPLRMLWGKILVLNIILIIGYIIYNLNENKKIYYALNFLLLTFLISYIGIYYKEAVNEYNIQVEESKVLRPLLYHSDEMAILYDKFDGIALLPITSYDKYGQHTSIYRPKCFDCRDNIRNLMIDLTTKEIFAQKTRIFTLNYDVNQPDNEYANYLKNTYDIDLDGIIFINDEKAIQEFERRGGKYINNSYNKILFSNLYKENKRTVNIELLNKLTEESPDNEFLYAAKGRIFLKNKEYDSAIKEFKTAINKSDKINPYYLLLANAYLEKGDKNSAIENYKKIIEYYPFSFNIMAKTAHLYIEIGDYNNAVNMYKKIIDIFPYVTYNDFRTYYNDIAFAEYKLENYKKTIDYINKAEEINPNDVNYLLRACAKINAGNIDALEEAQKDIDKAKHYIENEYYNNDIYNKIKEILINNQKCNVY